MKAADQQSKEKKMTQIGETELPHSPPRDGHTWWRVFLTGLGFYIATLAALILTGNPNLFPTVVMIGNFLIPITFVTFFYERRHLSRLSIPTTVKGFIYGGVLGVVAASLLEPLFIQRLDFVTAFVVGLIEEFVKIIGILVIMRHQEHDSEIDGIILGAAAGMGFAALESSGYVFSAFLRSGGSLSLTVGVTMMRGILSSFGHGAWTAILAGVLFRESDPQHFNYNLKVLGAYLTVVILHGLWDGLPGLIAFFVGQGLDIFLAQVAVGTIGVLILWRRWREARRLQEEQNLQYDQQGLEYQE
jgi:RsiW-degrading membrane proteinase PrsW (M82 family)